MSKPDPTITANLLGSLTGKPGPESAATIAQPGKPGHASKPASRPGKPKPAAPKKGPKGRADR